MTDRTDDRIRRNNQDEVQPVTNYEHEGSGEMTDEDLAAAFVEMWKRWEPRAVKSDPPDVEKQ